MPKIEENKLNMEEAEEYYNRLSNQFNGTPDRRYVILDTETKQKLYVSQFGRFCLVEDNEFISEPVTPKRLVKLLSGSDITTISLFSKK